MAFTVLCKPECPAGKDKKRLVALVTSCALTGELARLLFVLKLGLPSTAAAIAVGMLVVVLIKVFKLYFPPAGAMAVLALLIPEDAVLLYAPEVCLGISLLAAAAHYRVKKKLLKYDSEVL